MAPTTRRQQKLYDTETKSADLLSSTRSAETTMAPTTRQQKKRKAPSELEDSPIPKRTQNHCNGTHYLFKSQTGTTSTQAEQHRDPGPFESDATHHSASINEPLRPVCPGPSPSTTSSAFLSLPRELRDEIYKHILRTSGPRAVTLQNGHLLSTSSLTQTNTQTRQEYLDAVLLHAPVIHTTVRNHNFSPVVTFLNRLSTAQLHRFAATAVPNRDIAARERSRKIIITLTYARTKISTRPLLNRWLDRFDDPQRRGAEVRFEYSLDVESWRRGGYKQRVMERAGGSAGVRSREEAKKMIVATRGGRWGVWEY